MNSLRSQLILQIALPLAMLMSLVLWTTFQAVGSLLEQRLKKEIELVAQAMRVPVQRALVEGDLARVQQTLNAVFEIDPVYGAYVFDGQGRRVAVAGEIGPGWREQIEAAELVAIGEEMGRYADFSGEAVFSYFVPLTDRTGRIAGLLQVVRQESEIAARLDRLRARAAWIGALMVLLMLIVLVVGHRLAVVRPLEALLISMRRVESGESNHRAAVAGPRELASLASGLNRMLDGIDAMQAELGHQREQLRRQENLAALGRFSSGVAHELGAPLTVIDGDARRLQALAGLDSDAGRRLSRMRQQIDRTRQLIRQLMEFVRSDRRQAEPIALRRLLEQVAGSAAPQCEALKVELSLEPPAAGLVVTGFEIRLEHAVLNLVRNAIQAAQGRVLLSASDQQDALRIVVEDDGPGVPEDQYERIFEPFYSARPEGEGTGLGLAIVRTVADEHGARVLVDRSERLGGSRFQLVFERLDG